MFVLGEAGVDDDGFLGFDERDRAVGTLGLELLLPHGVAGLKDDDLSFLRFCHTRIVPGMTSRDALYYYSTISPPSVLAKIPSPFFTSPASDKSFSAFAWLNS